MYREPSLFFVDLSSTDSEARLRPRNQHFRHAAPPYQACIAITNLLCVLLKSLSSISTGRAMPQALQWLGHWNKASRAQWQLRQGLYTSLRTSDYIWFRNELQCSEFTRGISTLAATSRSTIQPRGRGAEEPTRAAISPTNLSTKSPSGCASLSENDPDSFQWNDFVFSTPKAGGTSNKFGAHTNPKTGRRFDLVDLCHELVAARRKAGRDGVLHVWSKLAKAQGLTKVEGLEADVFYQGVLEAALPSDIILEGIHTYADWLAEKHGIRWPHLYDRIISHCLESRQYERAFRWHLTLIAEFDPGHETFAAVILRHVHEPDADIQSTLRSMYIASHHRTLYDKVVPELYGQGNSGISIEWRDLLARFTDLPQHSVASQPFLHFLRTYYRGKILTPQEELLASSEPMYRVRMPMTQETTGTRLSRWRKPSPANDAIGARFLASFWIGPEFAVHALQGLGVHCLGPLSLQSLALRDPNPASVLARLKQLERLHIDIGESTYAKSIRHFAETDKGELLSALLRSDIHPEVFDDPSMRSQILANATAMGDWQTSRLLLAIQPAVAHHSTQTTSNSLLKRHVLSHETRLAVELMADMRAMEVGILPDTLDTICNHLLGATARDEPLSPSTIKGIHANIEVARSVTSFRQMIPSKIWRNLLHQLGLSGQQPALENLAIAIADGYQVKIAKGGLMVVHPSDLPPWAPHADVNEVPLDLPTSHLWHPINRILNDRKLQVLIVRWGFKAGLPLAPAARLQSVAATSPIKDFQVARGARLLQLLADRGVRLHLDSIREEIVSCLASHMGPDGRTSARPRTCIPWTSLPEVRHIFSMALGRNLLPQTPALRLLLLHAKSRRNSRTRGQNEHKSLIMYNTS